MQLIPTPKLPYQLHQTHTLANNLHHQMNSSVKWLRLEQEKVRQLLPAQRIRYEILEAIEPRHSV